REQRFRLGIVLGNGIGPPVAFRVDFIDVFSLFEIVIVYCFLTKNRCRLNWLRFRRHFHMAALFTVYSIKNKIVQHSTLKV
ncbi:hypothetical protein, partial [Neisseria gonorrhoeae]|uniref:hypothetical protein n=3 Tax=Neisseria gonorrhoeae TaxID=485 RepID=UPI00064C9574